MMEVVIKNETMERVREFANNLSSAENYIRIRLGIGSPDSVEGVEDAMKTSITIAGESDQGGLDIYTGVPAEVEKPLAECTREEPLEDVVVKSKDFINIVSALSVYEQDYLIKTDENRVLLSIAGVAEMPIYKADSKLMKAEIPTRNNVDVAKKVELLDPDIITVGVNAKDLFKGAKPVLAIKDVENLKGGSVSIAIRDTEPVMQEVEVKGEVRNVVRYNSRVQMLACIDRIMGNGYFDAKVMQKGAVRDVLSLVPEEIRAGAGENPVCVFKREEDGQLKCAAVPYATFKEKYDGARGIATEADPYRADEFQFAIPFAEFAKIISIASIVEDEKLIITVGRKYISVVFCQLGASYLTVQETVERSMINLFKRSREQVMTSVGSVEVDSKQFGNGLKLAMLYESDALIREFPLEVTFSEKEVVTARGEAKTVVPVIKANTVIDTVTHGFNPKMLQVAVNGLPAGNISINYAAEKAYVTLTQGDCKYTDEVNSVMLAGVQSIESSKAEVLAKFEKAQEDAKKKEEAAAKKKAEEE